MRSHRWLRSLPAGLALLGLAGVTSKLWMECRSSGTELQTSLFGVAWLLCAVLLAPQILTWERDGTRLRTRLAWSTLLVIGVGFVASILIGNLVGALDRGAQKRSMSAIRDLATIFEAHAKSQGTFPVFDGTSADLAPRLMRPASSQPIPIPMADAWGNPLLVRSDGKEYTIVSFGCCGEPDLPTVVVAPNGGTTSFQADIIFSDGSFIQFPDGTQW